MTQAKQGDRVRIHYTGKLKDGQVFDSSREREPLELTLGAGHVITGVEQAVEGMTPGESKVVEVPAAEGYGQRDQAMVVEFDRSSLPEGIDPQKGQPLQLKTRAGTTIPAVITQLTQAKVTVDANHPLAGRDLVFDLELLEIV